MGSKIEELVFRYLNRLLTASGDTPTVYTASGGTVSTVLCTALGQTDDYFNGAIIRWDSGGNSGEYSAVKDYVAGVGSPADDTLTIDTSLATAVVNGDTFTLFVGGKFISDQRIPGMEENGGVQQPPNATGVEFVYSSMINGEGNGTLKLYVTGGSPADVTATWTPPGEIEGSEVNVSDLNLNDEFVLKGGGTTNEDLSKYVILKRNAGSLPGASTSDTIALTIPESVFMMNVIGDETTPGVNIYRPVGIINTSADSKMYSAEVIAPNPFDGTTETTVAAGGNIGTGADTIGLTDTSNYPNSLFVAKINPSTKAIIDARYAYHKSGNEYTIQDPGAGIRGYTAVIWSVADTVIPMPWQEIGLDAPDDIGSPADDNFEDPATENTAPSGVTFSCPMIQAIALSIGDMAASGIYVVWEWFFIPALMRPYSSATARLKLFIDVNDE